MKLQADRRKTEIYSQENKDAVKAGKQRSELQTNEKPKFKGSENAAV